MKKIIGSILILVAIACKPDPATPEDPLAKVCHLEQITTLNNQTFTYKFDANNRLSEVLYKYIDQNKPQEQTVKFTYNAAGNILKAINSDGWDDEYFYDASGVLTRIDFKDPNGKLEDQYIVKMDAQNRITSMITLKYGLNVSYEYKGPNGIFSKSIVTYENYVMDDYQIKNYETDNTRKSHSLNIKGHLFEPTLFTDEIPYSNPLNFNPSSLLINSAQATTQFDEKWENFATGTRIYFDATLTRKYNENGYVIQEESLNKVDNVRNAFFYAYNNCK